MRQAIGYVRVSTDQQADEGVSLDAQRARIEAYAVASGLQLVEIIEDAGVSGGTPLESRAGGARLLAAIRKGKLDVIALKLDRLFRDAADALTVTRAWDRASVGLHLVDVGGQAINTGSAMGRMFLTMMAGFAELERGIIAERTAAALRHMKAQGQVYNHAPLGYRAQDGRLVAIDEEQVVVAEIRAMHTQGKTLREIAGDLNDRGIVGKRGGKFHASTIRAVLGNSLHVSV
jgi:DNA invertase Pin-like site-specific DNA recombinase